MKSQVIIVLLIFCTTLMAQLPKSIVDWTVEKVIANIRAEKQSLELLSGSRALRETDGTRAAEAALKLGEPAMKAIAKLLDDDSSIVRINSIWVLSRFRSEAAELLILKSLKDKEIQVRIAAFAALKSLGNETIRKELISMLTDKEPAIRIAALRQLAFERLKPPSHQQIDNYQRNALIEAVVKLLKDPEPEVREQLAFTLGSYRNSNSVVHLLKLIKDDVAKVRATAAQSLGDADSRHCVPDLLDALKDSDEEVVLAAAASLGKLQDPIAVERLFPLLKGKPHSRVVAVLSLQQIRDRRAVPELIKLLNDEDDRVRREVYSALGQLQDVRAVEPMSAMLKKRPSDVIHIAKPLGQLNDQRAVVPLVRAMFADSESQQVSDIVMSGLEFIRDPSVIRELAEHAIKQPTTFAAFVVRRDFHNKYRLANPYDRVDFAVWWEGQDRVYRKTEEQK